MHGSIPRMRRLLSCLLFAALLPGAEPPSLATEVTRADLDPAAFADWVDGTLSPIGPQRLKDGPGWIVWTTDGGPGLGLPFGAGRKPGVRHARLGFVRPIRTGTIIARAESLSVLAPGAAYPGDPADDRQWIAARRATPDGLTTAAHERDIAAWVLPPGTSTRALRFTHTAQAADPDYAGRIGSVWILSERYADLAPAAVASSSAAVTSNARLNDQRDNGWDAWDNGKDGQEKPIVESPAWVQLSWPAAQRISALVGLTLGARRVEVQACTAPADVHPGEAPESQWRTVVVAAPADPQYPRPIAPTPLPFSEPVTTRGVRLRFLEAIDESKAHPHLQGSSKQGRRVWLNELLALSPLGDAPLAPLPKTGTEVEHPPIAVRFTLPEARLVTLVIDGADGRRVRNLVSETPFPAGANTVWWDGMDDLGRDPEAARHGLYHVPGQFVAPGTYTVRGLSLTAPELRFEFPVYGSGNPTWTTADGTGGWTTNHTPPRSVLAIPAERSRDGRAMLYIGSHIAEGGHGLAWVDEEGRKIGGEHWLGGGGIWTGAQWLARDAGSQADAESIAYAAAAFDKEARLVRLTTGDDKPLTKLKRDTAVTLAGFAAHDRLLVCSLPSHRQLVFIDGVNGNELGTVEIDGVGSLGFDRQGRLLAIVGKRLVRYALTARPAGGSIVLPTPQTVVDGLEDPQQFTSDTNGDLYIADRGRSHQIKVFNATGGSLRTIGKPGAPQAGPYDPLRLTSPCGVAIDGQRRLWVAEEDFQPKRVSVWRLDGTFVKAFYGPSGYGGGGTLDSQDPTRFLLGGMVFKLDWKSGTDRLERVLFRTEAQAALFGGEFGSGGMPEMVHQAGGARWYSNWHDSSPVGGTNYAIVWRERGGIAVPAAAIGDAQCWPLLKGDGFRARWPQGVDPKADRWRNRAVFAWSDADGDGQPEPDEVVIAAGASGGVVLREDLTAVFSRLDGRTVRFAPRLAGERLSYDLAAGEVLVADVAEPKSSGGNQAWSFADGWTVVSLGIAPFSPYSLCGAFKGQPRWSYPNPWPGLHASHEAPVPDAPGRIIGVTRLLGAPVTPRGSDVGPLLAFNGNMGPMYLFTADGLFVTTLFRDVRQGKPWSMPVAERGMRLDDISPHDENFWPSIAQAPDGRIYLQDGARSSLVRVDNLDSARRLPDAVLQVTEADLAKAREVQVRNESARQKALGSGTIAVAIQREPLTVDGKLDDWPGSEWAPVDLRGTAANFNSDSKPYQVQAAARVAGERLHLAYRTTEPDLLRNSGADPVGLFKTGGCLDLMLAAKGGDPARAVPVEGDLRLLVTRVKDRTLAMLYRPVVPGTATPVPFSSPWRTIIIDRVDDVSAQVELGAADGNYELSIPLAALGWQPVAGTTIQADLGILRGDGISTFQRVYWSNKGTAIVSDVPSEAQLTPALWGRWRLTGAQ